MTLLGGAGGIIAGFYENVVHAEGLTQIGRFNWAIIFINFYINCPEIYHDTKASFG